MRNSSATKPDWRSNYARNELFSNSKAEQTSIVPKPVATSPALAKTLFSSPIADTKARSDWNDNKSLLQVNIPQQLKQINHADAAKVALSKFGMTPEKLAEGRNILSRDAAESTAQLTAQPKSPSRSMKTSKSNAAVPPPISTSAPKLNDVSTAPAMPMPETGHAKSDNDVDYKSLLTKFFQDHSPERLSEVDAVLQKYQVSERLSSWWEDKLLYSDFV